MNWFVIIGVILLAILLFGTPSKTKSRSKNLPRTARKRAYASMWRDGEFRDLSSEETTQHFAPFREAAQIHKREAATAERLAGRMFQSGSIDEEAVARIVLAHEASKRDLDAANVLFDSLSFESEASANKYARLVETLEIAEADLDDSLSSIEDTRRDIANGDYD